MPRILHAADFHLDTPFDALPPEKAAERRREQRRLLEDIVDMANEKEVDIILLAGDMADSATAYFETRDTLLAALARARARVFVATGNHDYYTASSPWAGDLPENVHVFSSPRVSCVELPELGCAVYGAGFDAPHHPCSMLEGFHVRDDGMVNIMLMHGEVAREGDYNPISGEDIAASGLDYLALGHIHTFSGIKSAGGVAYAWPGCPEGRGFDECGEKGVIMGEAEKSRVWLELVPTSRRRYRIIDADISGLDSLTELETLLPGDTGDDICRVVLHGEWDGAVDAEKLEALISGGFYHVAVRDRTRPRRDLWQGMDEDSLRGIFLKKMRERWDTSDERGRETVTMALRYAMAAFDGGEEP